MGITEDVAQKIIDEVIDGSYIPKSRFNEVNEELKVLKKSIAERDSQLDELKKSAGDNESLTKQIAELQEENSRQQKAHMDEMAALRLDNALETALMSAKAKNTKAVRAMLDLDKIKLDDKGELSGLSEQLDVLRKSDGYMFDEERAEKFTGFQPGVSAGLPDASKASYESRLAEARKNSNKLEVIKIKQEAANDGIILI